MTNLKENLKNYLAIKYYENSKKNIQTRGYERYKQDLIKKIINGKKIKFISYFDERVVEIPWVIKELKKCSGNLLDAGSTLNFKYILSNLNHFKKIFITTLYPEKNFFNDRNISYTYEDISDLSFKDKYFDVVTSISTIEHIGFNNDIYNYGGFKGKNRNIQQLKMSLFNLKRVLKKGGKLIMSFPYGKKGIYLNMQQFDKNSLKSILNLLKMRKVEINYFRYSNKEWIKSSDVELKNIEPNIKVINKKKIVLSANSIALIKLTK